jgi:hypothetical protein
MPEWVGVGEKAADLSVTVGRNDAHLGDLLVRSDFLGVLLQVCDHGFDGKVDAAASIAQPQGGGPGYFKKVRPPWI